MKLENTNPDTSAAFRLFVAGSGFALPLRHGPSPEIIEDARGRCFAEIDPDGNMSDEAARRAASAIILAVNTCAGFKAVRS